MSAFTSLYACLCLDILPTCAAVEDSQRGTLHVVLTKGSEMALEVSPDARQHLKLTSQAVGEFAGRYEDSVGLRAGIGNSSDPRAVAASINAQIQSLAPHLFSSGKKCSQIMALSNQGPRFEL